MPHILRESLTPGLVALAFFAACGSTTNDDDDDGGDGGQAGETAGNAGSGNATGAGRGGRGSAGTSSDGGSSVGGDSSATGGDTSAGGSADAGESGADNAGSGAEAGDATGSGGSAATGGGSTTGGSSGDGGGGTPGGAGGTTGGTGGSATGGGAGTGAAACTNPLVIEPLSHHLGDGDGAEGTTFSRTFNLSCTCTSPWLSFQIDGANRENPPHVSVNGSDLPSLMSFFPPVTAEDVWQTSGSSHDYNGYLQIHYDLGSRLVSGSNTFTLTNGTTADDYNFQDVRLECGSATTPPGPDIVNRASWVGYYDDRAGDDPYGIQGAFYAYGDGVSCTVPSSVCATGACCLSGATLGTDPTTNWGCGMGLQLHSTGGSSPTELAYAGAANCFDVEFTGNSGGSDVRMQAATHVDMSGRTAPVYSLGPVNGTLTKTVCFSDFACPASPQNPCSISGSWYRLEANVVGGVTAGAFNVCLQSLIPYTD